MSRPIYEPTPARADAELGYGKRQLYRRPAPAGSGSLPTFRASISGLGTGALRSYPSDPDELDTVFWDTWENPSPDYFDEFIQPAGPQAGLLGAVNLLTDGIYLIFCRIDWDDFFEGEVRIGGNYDDAPIHTKNHELAAFSWYGVDGFTEMRVFWPSYIGSEDFVEVVVGHNDPTLAAHTIPGGFGGAYAMPPELTIVYLGDHLGADNFMANF